MTTEQVILNILAIGLSLSVSYVIDLRKDMDKKDQIIQLYKNILKQNNLPC